MATLKLDISPDDDIGVVILQTENGKRWRYYRNPIRIIQTNKVEEVLALMSEVEALVNGGNVFAAGFVAYEAAPAFDSALSAHKATAFPLIWFGIYNSFEETDSLPETENATREKATIETWKPSVSERDYHEAIDKIHEYIASGDTYQVNYTIRLRTAFSSSAWEVFRKLVAAQEANYAAFINTGEDIICSASPELFFTLDGERIESRPMKGTRPRGRFVAEDTRLAKELAESEKERAENVMIVDMVRNDLGRIAEVGSVRVPKLFDVERFYTVWQMTSTVTASTNASITEIFHALFPCASITGAPKIRTSQIIHELEHTSRGIYTGAIGYIDPNRKAQWNIAIRTVHIHRATQRAEYGTGGGIVWDSTPDGEYREALTKAQVLTVSRPDFQLFETMLWTAKDGLFLRERHLDRMESSANYFGFACDRKQIENELAMLMPKSDEASRIVRLFLTKSGEIEIKQEPFESVTEQNIWRVALAKHPVNSTDRFLFHKTTYRLSNERAKRDFPGYDDVILWNERGEITESTRANVVVKMNGEWVTPPVECGLLAGTLRAELLETKQIREGMIMVADVNIAEEVALINSVRGWIKIQVDK